MSKKMLLYILLAITLVVSMLVGLSSCASAPPSKWTDIVYSGEDSKLLGGFSWVFSLDDTWEANDLELIKAEERKMFRIIDRTRFLISNFETIEFHPDGSLKSSYISKSTGFLTGQQINSTRNLETSSWERKGVDVRFALQNGSLYGEGKHNPETNIISGLLFSSDGYKIKFAFEYLGILGTRQNTLQSDFRTTGNSWTERGETIKVGNRMIAFTSINSYIGNSKILRIPSIINRALVISIRRDAFRNKQITSLTIPDRVNAGKDNRIEHHKNYNLLTNTTNPDIDGYDGINNIEDNAFANNPITRIVISGNIRISANAFDNKFAQVYDNNGKKAGTYIFNNGKWTWEDNKTTEIKVFDVANLPTITTQSTFNDPGVFAGSWRGTAMGYTAIAIISNSGWRLSIDGSLFDTGDFNRTGNTAVLYSNNLEGVNVGTANAISATQIQVILNSNSDAPGTYMMTKQ